MRCVLWYHLSESSANASFAQCANRCSAQFLGAFILVLVILAVTDKRNGPPPAGMVPLVIFIVFLGISSAYGMQTGNV